MLFLLWGQTVLAVLSDDSLKLMCDSLIGLLDSVTYYNNNGDLMRGNTFNAQAWQCYESIPLKQKGHKSIRRVYYRLLSISAWNETLRKNFSQAEYNYTKLIQELPENEHHELAMAYMGLSSIYGLQKVFDLSEKYALLSLHEAEIINDTEAIFHAQSNLGDIYIETGEYGKAMEKYLETRRLSVILEKHEAISTGNLALAYYRLGKKGLAEQYFIESLAMAKENAPMAYSIILTGYCELLIDNKSYKKARSLIMEAIKNSKYIQMDEYNIKFLQILSELEEAEQSSIGAGCWTIILLLLLLAFVSLKWRMAVKKQKEIMQNAGTGVELTPSSEPDGGNAEPLPESYDGNEMLLKTMALTEIMPQFWKIITRIKSMAASKTDVLKGIKEIEDVLGFLTPEKLGKDFPFYVEQETQDFYNKLKKIHPDLSLSDLRLCTLIKMGLNTKEIANLTNKSVRGVESGKFRLKKKLNLDTSKDIYDYLLEIEQCSE
ncbi:tetratricopeptide repeat protein [Bacteroides sp.]